MPRSGVSATSSQFRPPQRRPLGRTSASESDAIADYISEISLEMGRMAQGAKLDLLAYLLDMVHIEAELIRKRREEEGTEADPPDQGS